MRVMVTGASGQLGAFVLERLAGKAWDVVGLSHREPGRRAAIGLIPVDLLDVSATDRVLSVFRPEAVLHLAAVSSYEAVFRDPAGAVTLNVGATQRLAEWCEGRGARLVLASTDAVFDGREGWRTEEDPAWPVLGYGRTKRAAEDAVLAIPGGTAARLSLLYGVSRCGREAFFDRSIAALRRGETLKAFADEYRTPLAYEDAAEVLVGLLERDGIGLVHVGGPERLSRFEMMRRVASALGLDAGRVEPNERADVPSSEARPADTSLDSGKLAGLLPGVRRRRVEEVLGR